jgi:hypothetical protein
MMKIFGILAAAPMLLAAQQGTLSGPVAGFVFDGPAQVLRPVQGVPGASLLGDAINFGFPVSAVYTAPRQDSAIVVGADQSLHLFLLNGGAPTEVSLGGLTGMPTRVVFSPSGSAVALVSPGSARILTGLPNSATLAGSVKVDGAVFQSQIGMHSSSWAPSMALSDDGVYMLTVQDGSARLLSIHGQNRSLMAAQGSALLAFAAGNHDAAVMDSLVGLTMIRDAAGSAGMQLLAAPDEGLAGPAGLAFSQDEKTVYVASATAQSVAAFNLAAASRTAIGCACTPSTLAPMGNVYRLTDLTAGPLWLFDGTATTPRTVFVPARVAE